MEQLNNYNYSIREHRFTIWFFRSLIFITLMVLVLFFTIKINESVTIREGEIIADNPQIDVRAPFDCHFKEVLIREGDTVEKGDTLIIVENSELIAQRNKAAHELEYLIARVKSIDELQTFLNKKIKTYTSSNHISSQKLQLDTELLESHLEMTAYQYELMKGRLMSAKEKYEGDSILFHKDMLSKYEFNDTRDAYLALKERIAQIEEERITYGSGKRLVRNEHQKIENELAIGRLEIQESLNTLQQSKIEIQNQINLTEATKAQLESTLNLQYITSAEKGTVNFLFNTKLASNLILKGEMLVSVAPQSASYYAKVTVPEKELPYLVKGLSARLKLDAFNQFDFGTIEGTLDFIAERKENDFYYAHIRLPEQTPLNLRPGYTVRGEIIVNKRSIYQLFVKKLVSKIEGA